MRALLVPVGDSHYALRLEDVREVTEAPRVTELPSAPGAVLGIVNVHGAIVPLLDTGALLGLAPLREARWAVVADTARGAVALAASGLPSIQNLETPIGPAEDNRAAGRFATPGGAATLLEIDALVES